MQKLYRIIMRLCDWKLIPMIEVIYFIYNIGLIHTSNGEHTKALEYYFIFGHSNEIRFYPKLLIIWP
ncbi:hypothetical protein Ahy_B06g083545 [Arachis hypogaea]|uniref:Uncharacterized protein n=1 Tax=Arachis hypogaea TaxID=3818 RepID=A0A444YQ69_ARAHY|nr:hypothetical protein Ahy_B06g083545 [Arachis hypogaea]